MGYRSIDTIRFTQSIGCILEKKIRTRLVVTEFISFDGVIEGPGPDDPYQNAGCTLPYWRVEIGEFKLDELFGSDALLLGRDTSSGLPRPSQPE